MSGEELFKFNSNKGIDFSKFKLKLDSTNAAETKKNIFFSIFDKDNNQIIDSDEISELFGTFLGYAAIQGDKYTIDSDEAELMLNFIADKNGESLKAKGFSVKEVVDFIKNIQNQGNKTFERKQEADFQKQVNSVKQAIFYSDIDEKELKVSYKDVEAYARAVTGIHSKKELTEKEAQTLTNKIIELQLLNGPDFKYTAGATVASKGKKISQTILNLLKQRGITPNADTHGIFLAMAKCNDCVELYDMLKLFKKYEIKTTKEFQNAIKQQRSQDLQNYTAEVLIANIKEAIKILQQTEDNMGISFETAGEYIKKGIYAIFGWDRAKPISESKKELQDKLKLFETQLRMSLNNGTFKQTFKKLTGITYNEEKVEDFIEFSKKQNEKATIQPRCGEIGAMYAITDNINYQLKMKETFGIDFTRQAQDAQFRSADDGAGLELIAMIGLMAKFSASSAGRSFSSAVLKATARVLPKGLAKVAAPSIISGTTLGAFTGTTQIVRNLTKKAPTTKQDWQNTGWATLQSFGFGAFTGAFGATAGKWLTKTSYKGFAKVLKKTKLMKTDAQALSKVSARLEKLSAGGILKATDLIKTLKSASPAELAAHTVGFAAEIGGCTGYAALIEQPIKDMYSNGGFDEASIRSAMYQNCTTQEEIEKIKNLSGAELFLEYTKEKLGEQAEMLTKVKGISTVLGAVIGGKFAQFSMLNATEIKKIDVNGKLMFEIKTPLLERPITVESHEMVVSICMHTMALDIAKINEETRVNEGINEGGATHPDKGTGANGLLIEVDKITRQNDINQANYNPKRRKDASKPKVQEQVSAYLDKLLEDNPEISEMNETQSNIDINLEEMYHKIYILPDGTCISIGINSTGGNATWSKDNTPQFSFFENPDIIFWIRDINGTEHMLPAISESNIAKAKKILNYMTTLEIVPKDAISPGMKVCEIQEEAIRKRKLSAPHISSAQLPETMTANKPKLKTEISEAQGAGIISISTEAGENAGNVNFNVITYPDGKKVLHFEGLESYIDGAGVGTKLIGELIKKSYELGAEGRIEATASPMMSVSGKLTNLGFYYKMGFRAVDPKIDAQIRECIESGKEIPIALNYNVKIEYDQSRN